MRDRDDLAIEVVAFGEREYHLSQRQPQLVAVRLRRHIEPRYDVACEIVRRFRFAGRVSGKQAGKGADRCADKDVGKVVDVDSLHAH